MEVQSLLIKQHFQKLNFDRKDFQLSQYYEKFHKKNVPTILIIQVLKTKKIIKIVNFKQLIKTMCAKQDPRKLTKKKSKVRVCVCNGHIQNKE